MNRAAVVTGAAGYLGGHLCAELVARGVRVRALTRSDRGEEVLRGLDVQTQRADICDPRTARRLLDGL
ncbi:MAG TPA: NAD-dependent epimerase/dehydratase family protein, partial [Dermatophilaceae bacterium]|nr:NAD-dependent epimerase/dehydratase family protein [Dermatophilaceae bacterium]